MSNGTDLNNDVEVLERLGFENVKFYDDCEEGRYYDALKDKTKVEVLVNKNVLWRYLGVRSIEEVEWFELTESIIDSVKVEIKNGMHTFNSDLTQPLNAETLEFDNENKTVEAVQKIKTLAAVEENETTETSEVNETVEEVVTEAAPNDEREFTLKYSDDLPLVMEDSQLVLMFDEKLPLVVDDKEVTLEYIDELPLVMPDSKKRKRKNDDALSMFKGMQDSLFADGNDILDLYIRK